MVRRGLPLGGGRDAARYTTAGILRSRGFLVTHTPTKRIPEHVSVSKDGEWDVDVCNDFDSCFGNVEVANLDDAEEGD